MSRRYLVTDEVGEFGAVTVDADHVTVTLAPWFPDSPTEVVAVLRNLSEMLRSGRDPGGVPVVCAYLGIRIEPVDGAQ